MHEYHLPYYLVPPGHRPPALAALTRRSKFGRLT